MATDSKKVLEICPYEPPASGWVTRLKFVRAMIEAKGGACDVLDIGPSRKIERPGCIPVYSGRDYLAKVMRFARDGYVIHTHINAEYFRGMLLALAAVVIGRGAGCRCLVTFHAGIDQPFLRGWRKPVTAPFLASILGLSHAVICNSNAVRGMLSRYRDKSRIFPIPAFSRQYLDYNEVDLPDSMEEFLAAHIPVASTYLCFREGFFTDVVIRAMERITEQLPSFGLVIVGTGDGLKDFREELDRRNLGDKVLTGFDLPHDEFMTLLSRSAVHLRTPITDGVSSTVLEALSMKIPVVASDNGSRPDGVIVYRADDAGDLAEKIIRTVGARDEWSEAIATPAIDDTVTMEADLLMSGASNGVSSQDGGRRSR